MSLETVPASVTQVGVVPRDARPPEGVRRLQVLLIKPSKYDDDGYVMRYLRGVLPSNTLAALSGLSHEVVNRGLLGDIEVEVHVLDEHVQKINPRRLVRRAARSGGRTVVAICGVQTNQYPRGADMAIEFRKLGVPVMLGGFHVSGAIALSENGIPPEIQALMDAGVTVVKGEVEECWDALLRDALHDKLEPYYDLAIPDISGAPPPAVDPRLNRRFTDAHMGTVETGRGCPFDCSFCTIINVQGRKMRSRSPQKIKELVLENYKKRKIDYYFFTDDNFARNPLWSEIFDALIEIRRDEGIDVRFMMQVDLPSYRMKGFVERAAEAGCTQVFLGMETINDNNLKDASKRQNKVDEYRKIIDTWHAKGIACHAGYIIGFPHDTVENVRESVIRLRDEIQVDQASFFMLVPIPGSRDHVDAVKSGMPLESDYNRYDSFHATFPHPHMSAEQWTGAYLDAWRNFYSVKGMISILERTSEASYWNVFKNFVWYRYAALIENTHPMICGFFRFKDRRQRRPGYAIDSRWVHFKKRARELRRSLREVVAMYYDMQEVWLATRGRPRWYQNVARLREGYERAYERVAEVWTTENGEVWSETEGRGIADDYTNRGLARTCRAILRLDPFHIRARTRADLNEFWKQTRNKLKRGRVYRINPVRVAWNLARDVRLCARFNLELLASPSR